MSGPTAVSGLAGWWRADAITGLSDGAAVTTWPDSSGLARDMTATGTVTYKTGQLAGWPSVRFDGATGYTRTTGSAVAIAAQPFTQLIVCRSRVAVAGDQDIPCGPWNTGNPSVSFASFYFATDQTVNLWGGTSNRSAGTVTLTNPHVVEGIWNGASSLIGVDGTTNTSGSSIGTGAIPNDFAIGCYGPNEVVDSPYDGDIFEVLLYSGALTAGQRSLLRSYLSDKYAITVTGYASSATRLQPPKTRRRAANW